MRDRRADLTSREQLSLGLDVGGSIGLAVGIGAVVVGAVLVATARDTSALEQTRSEPWASWIPLVAVGPETFSLGMSSAF